MQVSVVINNDAKQITLTPENNTDKEMINILKTHDGDDISIKVGNFYRNSDRNLNKRVSICNGGYLRCYDDEQSLMIVLKNKDINV